MIVKQKPKFQVLITFLQVELASDTLQAKLSGIYLPPGQGQFGVLNVTGGQSGIQVAFRSQVSITSNFFSSSLTVEKTR